MQTWAIILACLLLSMPSDFAFSQIDEEAGVGLSPSSLAGEIPPLTKADVESALKELDSNASMEEAVKEGVRSKFRQAGKSLDEATVFRGKSEQYGELLESAPGTVAKTLQQLEAIRPADQVNTTSFTGSTKELQNQLDSLQAEIDSVSNELSRVTAQLAEVKGRPAEISDRLSAARSELEAIHQQWNGLGDPDTTSSPSRLSDRYLMQSEYAKLLAEMEMLKHEQLSQAAREELLTAEQQLLQRRVAHQTAEVEAFRTLLDQRLSTETNLIDARVSEAIDMLEPGNDEAQLLGVAVQVLAEKYESVVDDGRNVRDIDAKFVAEKKAILDEYALLREQAELGGGGAGMTQSLIDLKRRLLSIQREIAGSDVPDLDQTRLALLSVEAQLRKQGEFQTGISDDASQAELALVTLRREILEGLESQYTFLVRELAKLQSDKGLFSDEAEDIVDNIDELLFWMRSSPPISLATFTDIPGGLVWALGPQHRREVGQAFLHAFSVRPLRCALWLLAALALLLARPAIIAALANTGEQVRRISTDSYRHTLKAVLYTTLLALPAPLLLWFAAHALWQSPIGNEWIWDLAVGLQRVAWITFGAWLLAAVGHPSGLAVNHFNWKAFPIRRVRASMLLFVGGSVPLILLLASTFHDDQSHYFDSVGRAALILWELWAAYLLWRLFYRSGGILETLQKERPGAMMTHWRHLISQFILAFLIALVILAAVGYFTASVRLAFGLMFTVAIVAGGQILFAVVMRWFTVKHRKLALAEALERRRKRQEAAAEQCAEDAGNSELVSIDPEEEAVRSLDDITDETRKLLGLIFVMGIAVAVVVYWSKMFPVWSYLDTVFVPPFPTLSVLELTQSALIVLVTILVVRFLPGFLELAILRATNVKPGTRLAITTLCQYGVIASGIALFFGVLKVDWAQFGWIAAALSVGLGFGLQEVVANFVCGLILLFERPLRVGDIVTVEGMTGTVSRIHLRATTITNWDRQEFVVPNKTLITSTLLNWTLSSAVNRVLIPVGVAYGTDTEDARQIMLEIATEHPLVLEDPAPMATFEEFANSSLTLYLRAYLPNMENRLSVITEIHTAIERRFAESGIEIAFPQQDLHLRSGWETLRENFAADSADYDQRK